MNADYGDLAKKARDLEAKVEGLQEELAEARQDAEDAQENLRDLTTTLDRLLEEARDKAIVVANLVGEAYLSV